MSYEARDRFRLGLVVARGLVAGELERLEPVLERCKARGDGGTTISSLEGRMEQLRISDQTLADLIEAQTVMAAQGASWEDEVLQSLEKWRTDPLRGSR